jgi:hypothetical protein
MSEQLELSLHAMRRAGQRGKRLSDLELVRTFGTPVRDGHYLHRKDVDRAFGDLKRLLHRLEHLVGTYLVEREGTAVTLYQPTRAQRRRLRETAA